MPNYSWITEFFPTPLNFRYHLPLTNSYAILQTEGEKYSFKGLQSLSRIRIRTY